VEKWFGEIAGLSRRGTTSALPSEGDGTLQERAPVLWPGIIAGFDSPRGRANRGVHGRTPLLGRLERTAAQSCWGVPSRSFEGRARSLSGGATPGGTWSLTMFDIGSLFQQMWMTISDLFVSQILGLISGLFSGLLG